MTLPELPSLVALQAPVKSIELRILLMRVEFVPVIDRSTNIHLNKSTLRLPAYTDALYNGKDFKVQGDLFHDKEYSGCRDRI